MQEAIVRNEINGSRQEIRCKHCDKMLARTSVKAFNEWSVPISAEVTEVADDGKNKLLEIKCPRCKTLNEIMV